MPVIAFDPLLERVGIAPVHQHFFVVVELQNRDVAAPEFVGDQARWPAQVGHDADGDAAEVNAPPHWFFRVVGDGKTFSAKVFNRDFGARANVFDPVGKALRVDTLCGTGGHVKGDRFAPFRKMTA